MGFLIAAVLGLSTAGQAFANDFSYEDLVSLIQKNDYRAIEELLPALPTDFRAGYALMYKSRSLQGASDADPRAILFGKNAKLTCAFNGDPSQIGYDALECLQFRDDERAFDFRQIRFPTKANHLPGVQYSLRGRSADGAISCSQCHFADPRPNWDAYRTWPGAYGEDDDLISDGQKANYARFVQGRDAHPRYRSLIQDTYADAPFQAGDSGLGRQRPNLRFSDLINKWNSLRAARIMSSGLPHWQMLAFAVSALKCGFTPEQTAEMQRAKLDFSKDGDLKRIFAKFNGKMSGPEWSTEIAQDSDGGYAHNAGFGNTVSDIGMSVVQDLANGGDSVLKSGLSAIVNAYTNDPTLKQYENVDLFQEMGQIIPELYYSNDPAAATLCPELVATFVPEYLKSASAL